MSAKKWTASCPVHGTVAITQKTRPTVCKEQDLLPNGRSFRQCRRELLSVTPTHPNQKALL